MLASNLAVFGRARFAVGGMLFLFGGSPVSFLRRSYDGDSSRWVFKRECAGGLEVRGEMSLASCCSLVAMTSSTFSFAGSTARDAGQVQVVDKEFHDSLVIF